MRVIVLFDLPVLSDSERREYTRFRKFLIKSGFLMMQESVYVKLALNQTAAQSICEQVRCHKPAAGLVQMLTITEKQFQKAYKQRESVQIYVHPLSIHSPTI